MSRQWSFDGKTIVVTGGTSGIGARTALRFAQAGASVVALGLDATGPHAPVHPGVRRVGLDVTEAHPAQRGDVDHLADRLGHEGEEPSRSGVEQHRLVAGHEVLVEGEAAGSGLGDGGREAVHAVRDLVDVGLHGCIVLPWSRSHIGVATPN